MMNRLGQEIRVTLPDELVPAVEALREMLDDAYFKCGKITEVFCYGLLHPGEYSKETQDYKLALIQLKVVVGPAATEVCHQRIKIGTAPAFFHALNQLYIAGVSIQAIHTFKELLDIGKVHADRLGKPYIQWARDLTMDLVKRFEDRPKFWIRAVCDPPDFDLVWDDPNEPIMGKTWCAPMLLVMHPSRSMPFDASRQWERVDRETSKRWLNSFTELFTIHIQMHIDRLAAEKTVEFAKNAKPVLESKPEIANTGAATSPMPKAEQVTQAKVTPNRVSQESGKRKTLARNRKIRSEFRSLVVRRPGMSKVWYSQQLATSPISGGLDSETIRKIIRG